MSNSHRANWATWLLSALSWLPLPLLHGIGAAIGWLFYLFPNRHRRIAERNISLCFPELDQQQQRGLLRRTMIETGKTLTEAPVMWCRKAHQLMRLVRKVSGLELMEKGIEHRKGVIIAGPHLGCWEFLGHYLAGQHPITNLYRPPRYIAFDTVMKQGRQRLGAKLAPTDVSGIKQLLKALKHGEMIGILPDQDPRKSGGVFAPLFGIQANTMTLLNRLANKSGATVLIGFAERLPWGKGYHIHLLPLPEAIGGTDVELSARLLNEGVERAIYLAPSQYQWSYKRFRTRPEGESSVY
jgi:KDO2-lipid IV(A) lauroyltransferase